jgi:hypothetical protein
MVMNQEAEDLVGAAQEIEQFAGFAERYCRLIEEAQLYNKAAFLREAQPLLFALCSRAMELPDLEPDSESVLESEITDAAWRQVFNSLGTLLGKHDPYRVVFDPIDPEESEPVCGSLSDDLADIYRDLKNGLISRNSPEKLAEVIWEWKFSFQNHWGRHATEALRVIHSLLYGPYSITDS